MLKLQKPVSTATQQELKTLKKAINDGHDAVEMIVERTKDEANSAVTEAILVGERLHRVKKIVPYGSFLRWLKDNCKKISVRTAQRYMTLATRKASLLKTDLGLRQAYALIGIIRDDQIDRDAETSTNHRDVPSSTQSIKPQKHKPARVSPAPLNTKPVIQKDELLSRAKFLTDELMKDLQSKLNNELIDKQDARKILQPLIDLTAN